MKAVILAGGRGERMGKITKKIPKPMIRIGGLPVLEHQINLLKRYNIKEIILIVNYLSEVIEKYFVDGKKLGVKISYFKEGIPLGTTGGIKEIENELKEDFIVIYGDIMLDVDMSRIIAFHRKKNSVCTMVVHPNNHPYDSDLVEVDDNQRIVAFHPKPHEDGKYFRNLVNAGLYVMSPEILKYVKKGAKSDFGKDIFPKIFRKAILYGYNTAEYLKDIGTPKRLLEVEKDYFSGKIRRLNNSNKRRAIFLDRDGTISPKFKQDIYKVENFGLLPNSANAIRKINKSNYLTIVITNQPSVAKGFCTEQDVKEVHKKMETLIGKEGAKLDAIYYCPHHPEKGFKGENKKYKIDCNCRKHKIGLVKEAQEDFNIDLKKSYFIGDSYRDILCGKNAGLTTIGVKTGDSCKDEKIKPDFLFDNLYQAVNFIIKNNIK